MGIERFEDIEAWKLARTLSQEVFRLAEEGTLGKDYSLKDQMYRASGSAMNNIAEGFDSGSNREFVRFLQYPKGSCPELQSQLYRAMDRKHCDETQFLRLYDLAKLTRSKIGGFVRYLSQNLKHNQNLPP